DIGYITVFTLPYELENLAFATPVGKLSNLYKSKSGYHIFKNVAERKAVGKIKAAQILIALPPDANNLYTTQAKALADSLYNRLQQGDDFGKLAAAFSNDVISSAANGQMTDLEVGQYSPVFETAVFNLPNNGAITKPFFTEHGWHIVKLVNRIPVNSKKDDSTLRTIREKVEASDRMNTAKAALVKKIMMQAGYKKLNEPNAAFFKLTENVIITNANTDSGVINSQTALFQLNEKKITFKDWIYHARMNRYKSDGSGVKSYDVLWDEFLTSYMLDYYRENLESYNPDFKAQIAELSDGNLFFDIMQQEVWGPAQSDTAALENYFKQHQSKYFWNKSADAVIFYASDAATANELRTKMSESPRWKALVNEYGEKLAADSARFEITQIPNGEKTVLKPATLTPVLVNASDNTASFAYIIKYYPQTEKRNFTEARGLVINDYQQELEKKWITELKKKYPVIVDEKVWNDLSRKFKN
ncbi:MAG: peptidylprolyl isomerase, partial [Chitinophagaceae bacterium]